jgi:hypothetical protein
VKKVRKSCCEPAEFIQKFKDKAWTLGGVRRNKMGLRLKSGSGKVDRGRVLNTNSS